MPKELALQQGLGEGRTVQRQEGALRSRRVTMKDFSEPLLSDARFTEDKDVDVAGGDSPYQLEQLLHRGNFRPSIGGVIPASLAHCSSCFAPSHPSPALAHSVPSGTENDELFQQHDFRCTLPTPGGSARDGGADDSGTGDGATKVGRRGRLLLPSAPGPPTVGALESFM